MIRYLIVYVLGLVTPILFKFFVLPRLKKKIKEKVRLW